MEGSEIMDVSAEQFDKFLKLLELLSVQKYTLTGAADWQILQIVGGGLIGLLFVFMAAMWADIKSTVKGNRTEWISSLKDHVIEQKNDFDEVWTEIRRCQDNCCDFGGRRKEDHHHQT